MPPATPQDELDFQQMWKDAQSNFERRTSKSLTHSSKKSLDNILEELQTKFADNAEDGLDDKSSRRKKKVKEVLGNVLTFINLLGGLAAQGASIVFGPATMCFNAVQVLFDMHARIGRFYADLAEMFQEIDTFLRQFQIYQRVERYGEIDVELKRGTHKLLTVFVDVVALSIEIVSASRLKRLGNVAKLTLFDDDSGVRSRLDEFQRLIQLQTHISDAVTLEAVVKAEHNISSSVYSVYEKLMASSESSRKELASKLDFVHDDVKILVTDRNERTAEKRVKTHLDKIADRLGVKRESSKSQDSRFFKYRQDSVPKTGSWLSDVSKYDLWTKDRSNHPMLLICGANGSGKTHLLSAIAHELRYETDTEARSPLAVFAFSGKTESKLNPADETSSERDTSHQSVIALKHAALQLAEQDAKYAKDVWIRLERKEPSFFRDIDCEELCRELFPAPSTESAISVAREVRFVLIFDGLDKLLAEDAKQFFRALYGVRQRGIRTIMSATSETMRTCMEQLGLGLGSSSVIHNEEHNDDDINKFIESELKRRQTFHGDAAEVQRLVQLCKDEVPQIAKGNFASVQWLLDRIESSIDDDVKVDEVISRYLSEDTVVDRSSLGRQVVEDIQETLSKQQIEQLNVILIWAMYPRNWLNASKIQAALYIQTGRATLQLEKKIKERYGKAVFIGADGEVQAHQVIESYFRDQTRAIDLSAEALSKSTRSNSVVNKIANADEPTISMSIELKNVKLSQARRFFWNLSERSLFNEAPFRFDSSEPDVEVTKEQLRASPVEGHLLIARACFSLLSQDVNEETSALIDYALEELPEHIRQLNDYRYLDQLRFDEKVEILHNLVDLLREPEEWVERHGMKSNNLDLYWFPSASNVCDSIWSWFYDPEIIKTLKPKEQRWVAHVTADPDHCENVLLGVTRCLAKKLLHDREWDDNYSDVFSWISSFLDLQERKPFETMSHDDPSGRSDSDGAMSEKADSEDVVPDQSPDVHHQDGAEDATQQPVNGTDSPPNKEPNIDDAQPSPEQEETTSQTADVIDDASPSEPRAGIRVNTEPEQSSPADDTEVILTEKTDADAGPTAERDDLEPAKTLEQIVSKERVDRVVRWVEEHASPTKINGDSSKDSLWYERLGWLYLHQECFEDAAEQFLKAQSLPDPNWRATEGLARCLNQQDRTSDAIKEMRPVVKELREFSPERSPASQTAFLANLESLATWQRDEKMFEEAVQTLTEIIEQDPYQFRIYHQLFGVLLDADKVGDARETLEQLGNQPGKDEKLMKLQEMLLYYATGEDPFGYFQRLLVVTKDTPIVDKLFQISESTIDYAREENMIPTMITLLLARGDALAFQDQTLAFQNEAALKEWKECCKLGFSANISATAPMVFEAAVHIVKYHYQHASTSRKNAIATSADVDELDFIETAVRNNWTGDISEARYSLARFYFDDGQVQRAYALLKEDMRAAFDILWDNDPTNDDFGYIKLVTVLTHVDSDAAALGAISLLARHDHAALADPDIDEDRKWRATISCDGGCSREWKGFGDLWLCKLCPRVYLCDDCVGKIDKGTLDWLVCSADHDRIHVPAWPDEEFDDLTIDEVKVGGKIIDGKRIGGAIIQVSDWLETLRQAWDIEKPSLN